MMNWIAHFRERIHYALHAIFIPVAIWAWNERRILKGVLEDKLERRHLPMNPAEIMAAIQLAPELLPAAVQILTDFNKLASDVTAFLAKIEAVQKGATPAPAAPVATPPAS
jgi:hypothetical protein